jgi:2,3-dihydroxybenzoate-AMP ligase
MTSPISEHTVPRPEADAARYVAEGYWAGIPIGRLLRQVADRSAGARALVDPAAWLSLRSTELAASAGRPAILRADIITSASALDDALGLLDGDTWRARVRSAQGHEIPARKVNLHAIR